MHAAATTRQLHTDASAPCGSPDVYLGLELRYSVWTSSYSLASYDNNYTS